ncbi:MAG TPA: AAA family ATPase [Actinomycetota bacterium]|nr:AAA family ATPase [Actinomycetota bacterium]
MDPSEQLRPFVPRLIYDWVRRFPDRHALEIDGTLAFIDISGFTSMTERLARRGRIGAEELNDILNGLFGELIPVAYDDGAGLLKWGGDAALLLFDGDDHAARASRAAVRMQKTIRTAGRITTSAGQVRLRMSIGINSGTFNLFLVGDPAIHRELVIAGPASTGTVLMEQTAEAGEVAISAITAAAIDPAAVGRAKGEGFLLRREPDAASYPAQPRPDVAGVDLRTFVPAAVREYLLAGEAEPEHRRITAAFVEFPGSDDLLRAEGPEAAAAAIDTCLRTVQTAALRDGVGFFESDVSRNGWRVMLIVGAPQSAGEDEDRMLATLRTILETPLPFPVKAGTNAGHVFSAYFGPPFRKTYSVKGDAVNLAARLMAKAPPGELYATAEVLDHSMTVFDLTELEPFLVKGKRDPIRAFSVGARVGVRDLREGARRYPLLGREKEVAELTGTLAEVRGGAARTLELIGESGIGKTRLAEELRGEATDFRQVGAVGETYTAATPYVAWRGVLRELFGLSWEDPADVVVRRLTEIAAAFDPERMPWLPLIATAADAEMEPTPEVRDLDPEFLRPKLHDSLLRFLRAVQPGPTLFVFENAHLMDEASADLLAAFAAEQIDRPWCVLALRRPAEEGFHAPDASGVRRLEVGPLDRGTTIALAEIATDEAPLPAHVLEQAAERSGGNPQFLLDLVAASAAGDGALPASVEAAAVVRIDRLPTWTRELVRRASVFGLAFHPRFFNDVLDEGMQRPDAATWVGLAEFFEEEDDGYLRFRRAVIRDAAYAGLPFRVRQRVHAVAGRLFEEMAEDPVDSAGLLSLHFSAAGEWAKAFRYASIAAAHASGIYANVEAIRLYQRALEAGRRCGEADERLSGLCERLGDVRHRAGLYAEAKKAYSEAARLSGGVSLVRARLWMKRSILEESLGRLPVALGLLSRARTAIAGETSDEAVALRAQIDARYASVLQAEGRNADAIRTATTAVDEADASRSFGSLASAHNTLAMALITLGQPGAFDHWHEALDLYDRTGDLPGQAMIHLNLGAGAYMEGRWADALAEYEPAREAYERLGDPVSVALVRSNGAEILSDQGWLAEAEAEWRDTLRVWRAADDHYGLGFTHSHLGRVAARSGRFEEALASFGRARAELQHVGAGGDLMELDAREAECCLLRGDADDALARADVVIGILEEPTTGSLVPLLQRVRGYALARRADLEGARAAFEASLVASRARDADHETAMTLQGLIRLGRLEGTDEAALYEESGRLLDELGVIAVPAFPIHPDPARGG